MNDDCDDLLRARCLGFSTVSHRSLPFDAADVFSAESPVDTEPFSALVSFPLQADADARTESVLKHVR